MGLIKSFKNNFNYYQNLVRDQVDLNEATLSLMLYCPQPTERSCQHIGPKINTVGPTMSNTHLLTAAAADLKIFS